MTRWGKAGVRLTEQEAAHRARQAVARRNRQQAKQHDNNRVAYRLWRAGELKPYAITTALDARGLYGPEVDIACGAPPRVWAFDPAAVEATVAGAPARMPEPEGDR